MEEGGRHFVQLNKSDDALVRFFTGERVKARPLAGVGLFAALAKLRNEAVRCRGELQSEEEVESEVEDMGLDLVSAPSRRRGRNSWAYAKRPRLQDPKSCCPAILDIVEKGHVLSVLRGDDPREIHVEFTAANMVFLYKEVSEALASARCGSAKEDGGDLSQSDDGPRTPAKTVRGLTFVEQRRCWLLRYKDSDGHPHQKRFAVRGKPDSSEYAAVKEEARRAALSWHGELADATSRGSPPDSRGGGSEEVDALDI